MVKLGASVNLICGIWLPVRRRSGSLGIAAPIDLSALADDPVVALDFPRPEWNAAVEELLIGLLALAFQPTGAEDWADAWEAPPAPEAFATALDAYSAAFAINGPTYAFQDNDPLINLKPRAIGRLMIDGAAENAAVMNTDLFVKRNRTEALCLPFAVAALVTMQAYAPEGGPGFRTSLRGGGPLTTLMRPNYSPTLWHRLWANVPFVRDVPNAHDPALSRVLPWLAPTRVSVNDSVTGPDDVHPLLTLFACPCRIRLIIDAADDLTCAFGGMERFGVGISTVSSWRTVKHGPKYLGIRHPLSPYYNDPKSGALPLHAGPSSQTYSNWLGIWGGLREPAEVVGRWGGLRRDGDAGHATIDAHGFDMKQMKARRWVEARVPFHSLPEDERNAFIATAGQMIAAAKEAANGLSYNVRLARAGEFRTDQAGRESFQLRDGIADGLGADAAEAFWHESEAAFRTALDRLKMDPLDLAATQRQAWLAALNKDCLDLFNRLLGDDNVGLTPDSMKRRIKARERMRSVVSPYGKAAEAMKIAVKLPKVRKAA